MRTVGWLRGLGLVAVGGVLALSQAPSPKFEWFRVMSRDAERKGLAEAFRGITANGNVDPGLFQLRSTGVSTEPVRKAAEAWLASLKPDQRKAASFAVDSEEWRKWMNQHFYQRQGVSFLEMDEQQRGLAMGLLRASLSARGMKLTEDIMHLDTTLGELNNNNFEEYGERRYWITIMGTPSTKEPWGWQIDGHHLIVNYFVLGDQVVMTPTFTGSEPVIAKGGKYAGTTILQEEQNGGLRLVRSLSDAQRKKAVLQVSKTGNNNLTEAFKDNVVLDYQGLKGSEMDAEQKKALLALVERYVGNLKEGHAKVRMEEVKRHLESTWFAWIGDTSEGGVFYYRVHSPVVLIEFDHQLPVGIRHLYPGGRPVPEHVHTVVRTPNGNDYGKDLLRQHYAAMRH